MTKAIEFFKKSCDLDSDKACNDVGAIYTQKKRTPHNLQIAFMYMSKGCTLGNRFSCHTLSYLYGQGLGTEKNIDKAMESLDRSCRLGLDKACYEMGEILMYNKQPKNALYYYGQACKHGVQEACKKSHP